MYFEEFKNQVLEMYKSKFPKSNCRCVISNCLGKTIYIDFFLSENLNECPHNIEINDCFNIGFFIRLPRSFDEAFELPEEIELNCREKAYKIKSANRFLCFDHKKLSFRKTSGSPEKILTSLGKFIDKLYKSFMEDFNSGNLLDFDMDLVRSKEY